MYDIPSKNYQGNMTYKEKQISSNRYRSRNIPDNWITKENIKTVMIIFLFV